MEMEFDYLSDRGGHGGHIAEFGIETIFFQKLFSCTLIYHFSIRYRLDILI